MTPEEETELLRGRADAGALALAWADDQDGAMAMLGQVTFGESAQLLISLLGTVADMVRLGDTAEHRALEQPSPRRMLTELIAAASSGVGH